MLCALRARPGGVQQTFFSSSAFMAHSFFPSTPLSLNTAVYLPRPFFSSIVPTSATLYSIIVAIATAPRERSHAAVLW